jgi:anti-anti-sigma factor
MNKLHLDPVLNYQTSWFSNLRQGSMMVDVYIQDLGGQVVLRCAGRIVAGRESEILRKAALSQSDARTVVLDLTQVEAIDGGGIGLLVFLQAWAHASGKELKLLNPAPHISELLKLTNLDSVFEILSSEDMALSAEAVRATNDTAAYQCD